jgi:hypothetical protein
LLRRFGPVRDPSEEAECAFAQPFRAKERGHDDDGRRSDPRGSVEGGEGGMDEPCGGGACDHGGGASHDTA